MFIGEAVREPTGPPLPFPFPAAETETYHYDSKRFPRVLRIITGGMMTALISEVERTAGLLI